MPPLLTAVLVLYRMHLRESPCFQSLTAAGVLDGRATLLVFDNSPEPDPAATDATAWGQPVLYRHDRDNGGVAAAYNFGLAEARSNGSPWLLLLDQDTELTREYLQELLHAVEAVPHSVSAVVPRLMENGATHSPQHLPQLSHRPLSEATTGLLPVEVTAFNSGAALRVAALPGGFPPRYWLDFLDHAVFHQLQAAGGQVWLLHARLQHELSTESLGGDASLLRYRNVLLAERDFYVEFGSTRSRIWYRLRRMKQALGQALKLRDSRFARLSLRAGLGLLPPTPPR